MLKKHVWREQIVIGSYLWKDCLGSSAEILEPCSVTIVLGRTPIVDIYKTTNSNLIYV